MPTFSAISRERLESCDERLQRVFQAVIRCFDCSIIEGHRGQAEQHRAYMTGKSKVDWPKGKHNTLPSKAVDM